MIEGLWSCISASPLLKVVITYSRRDFESFLKVTFLEGAEHGIVMIGPESRIEIGL